MSTSTNMEYIDDRFFYEETLMTEKEMKVLDDKIEKILKENPPAEFSQDRLKKHSNDLKMLTEATKEELMTPSGPSFKQNKTGDDLLPSGTAESRHSFGQFHQKMDNISIYSIEQNGPVVNYIRGYNFGGIMNIPTHKKKVTFVEPWEETMIKPAPFLTENPPSILKKTSSPEITLNCQNLIADAEQPSAGLNPCFVQRDSTIDLDFFNEMNESFQLPLPLQQFERGPRRFQETDKTPIMIFGVVLGIVFLVAFGFVAL